VERAQQRAEQPFDVAAHVRLRDRTVLQPNAILLARPTQHFAVKFLGAVEMDALRKAPARSGPNDPALGEPCFFRQYGVSDAQTGRDRPRRIERDVEAQGHPAVDVDRQGSTAARSANAAARRRR
jgi:hypothetical protein